MTRARYAMPLNAIQRLQDSWALLLARPDLDPVGLSQSAPVSLDEATDMFTVYLKLAFAGFEVPNNYELAKAISDA